MLQRKLDHSEMHAEVKRLQVENEGLCSVSFYEVSCVFLSAISLPSFPYTLPTYLHTHARTGNCLCSVSFYEVSCVFLSAISLPSFPYPLPTYLP